MDFKERLTIISDDLNHDIITEQEARKQICVLLDVVGQSEQLVCPETHKLCERKNTYYCNRLCERI